ncbi:MULTISPECIES: hypothetical protein [unclassified Polaribacter]|jgi:hypothetical protein|uniref:hypothetical protein n=1 Tax=unclassified Polaribacter TaxID=196858 RepID=UPI001C4FEFC7|nr:MULTISPECIES: hypothetical protein [unclassified Polaribacter]QXP63219.1 hypothetical protein H0I27_15425 [Polaribacter sp. HaHaR_3_91]QXP63283.1 hypothetical protein H0I27_15795 [Polaribacter sp. HaHaR_3_91]QXP65735.1 hypothetical protein H0I28_11045 [Polaribacter sp. AHE13PA]QXP65777.1 hypothetical protein H0I28_11280 [Polaribacter sp. AHE13PA]QXP71251.1 hypothetical protein H0I29_03960 [Polaribacter sp. R2A056_3_33]
MNAEIVYQVAKALPKEEQRLLFDKLKKDFAIVSKPKKHKHKPLLSTEDALEYLLKNVFSRKQ